MDDVLAVQTLRDEGRTVMIKFVDLNPGHNKVEKSLRNIPNIKVTDINHFSAFDIIKYKKIVFTETSVKELEKRYA